MARDWPQAERDAMLQDLINAGDMELGLELGGRWPRVLSYLAAFVLGGIVMQLITFGIFSWLRWKGGA